jgi:hypothetical protein
MSRTARYRTGPCCFYTALFVLLLAAADYVLLTRYVLPVPSSTELDRQIVMWLIAPVLAMAGVFATVLTGWLISLAVPRRK